MLQEYITKYIAAKNAGDKKTMSRIERDLSKLGMDRHTLLTLTGGKHHDA